MVDFAPSRVDLPDFEIPGKTTAFQSPQADGGLPILEFLFDRIDASVEDSVRTKIIVEFNKLHGLIVESLERPGIGYLLKARYFTNEFGHAFIPEGGFVVPVGIGVEPLDALANYWTIDRLEGLDPKGLIDQSWYFWATPGAAGLKVTSLPPDLARFLEQESAKEAARRRAFALSYFAYEGITPALISRAEFWASVYKDRAGAISRSSTLARLRDLNSQLAESQVRLEGYLRQHSQTIEEMACARREEQKLAVLQNILSIAQGAMELGQFTANGNPVRSDDLGLERLADVLGSRNNEFILRAERYQSEVSMKYGTEAEYFRKVDRSIVEIYQQNGVRTDATPISLPQL